MTPATDVYALGVLLFQLIVGRHPTADPDMTEAAVLLALAERDAPRPSDAVARLPDTEGSARLFAERRTTRERLQRACKGDLDAIVGTALKKDVAMRYPSVGAFADDVRRYLSGDGVKARGDSRRYRLRKFVARHRLRLGAAAAMVTTLVVAAVAGWVVYRDKRIQHLRQETLPRIVAMQKKTDFAAAYRLLRTVEPELLGDPELERTRAEVLVQTTIRTSPPGADVYIKGYNEIAEEWLYLRKDAARGHACAVRLLPMAGAERRVHDVRGRRSARAEHHHDRAAAPSARCLPEWSTCREAPSRFSRAASGFRRSISTRTR